MVYARKSNAVPFQTYEEFLGSYGEEMSDEASYAQLNHAFDYLEQIQVDNSPESYFQFVVLAILGDQFSLSWHGLYNDVKILCDSSDMTYINEDMKDYSLVFPQGMTDRIEQVDFEPVIIVDENTVTVRFVTFTKWGGFFEFVYVMDKQNPMQLIDAKYNPLIEYDCGIMF